jgi:hypothetical protein
MAPESPVVAAWQQKDGALVVDVEGVAGHGACHRVAVALGVDAEGGETRHRASDSSGRAAQAGTPALRALIVDLCSHLPA